MVDRYGWLIGVSWLLLLTRFVAAAGVVRLLIQGTGLAWGLGLAVTLSICLAPLGAESSVLTKHPLPFALMQELMLGLCMGGSLALLVAGIQFVSNFAFAASPWGLESLDTPAAPLRKLFLFVSIAGFLYVQGDHIVLQQLLDSLQKFPPGQEHLDHNLAGSYGTLLSTCFRTSLILAAPLIAAVLFTHLLMGVISRSLSPAWLPTLHGFSVPLMLTVLSVGLIAWASWLPNQLPSFWYDQLVSMAVRRTP